MVTEGYNLPMVVQDKCYWPSITSYLVGIDSHGQKFRPVLSLLRNLFSHWELRDNSRAVVARVVPTFCVSRAHQTASICIWGFDLYWTNQTFSPMQYPHTLVQRVPPMPLSWPLLLPEDPGITWQRQRGFQCSIISMNAGLAGSS